MSKHKIYIFSQRVHSGKTTILQKWLRKGGKDVAGILTPDVNGKRMLYDIAANEYYDFDLGDDGKPDEVLFVGKYRFSKAVFAKAREILMTAVEHKHDWIIVDEVGKLEVDEDDGLEPALGEIVKQYQDGAEGKLILVVRDYLLDDVIHKYGLNRDMVLRKAFFE